MIAILRGISIFAMLYGAWVVFRVAADWMGILGGIVSVILLPISMPAFAFIMPFVPTSAAGPLALWPAIATVAVMEWVARKRGLTLAIKRHVQ